MAKNSFSHATLGANRLTRKFGTGTDTIEPYLTGGAHIHFSYIPSTVTETMSLQTDDKTTLFTEPSYISNYLASTCLSVNIPPKTLSKTEFSALGGIRWSVPTNVETDTNFSMRFIESFGIPVRQIFHHWIRTIRDSRTGTSHLTGSRYRKHNYAGTLFYWTTKPDGKEVEYSSCFTGVFPLRDPADSFGHDLAAIDKLEIDMDFSFDYQWEQDWVKNRCQALANTRSIGINTVNNVYGENSPMTKI